MSRANNSARAQHFVHKERKLEIWQEVKGMIRLVKHKGHIPGSLRCRIVDGQFLTPPLPDHYMIVVSAEFESR